ncbi:TonB-dependent receptor [uncultured Draconibacterium sp.]|uniref:TonB-dependent receptor n=1 Tax=uncultured Draconibacterium sp. TaxID=1573823 RepID=UPI002AA799B3|nr:TonB-dependent receptor [uncultured Draconibacterium sp.]
MKKNSYELVSIIRSIRKSKLLVAMKATIFILLISITQVFAVDSYSQTTRLSLSMHNSSIKTIIEEIEQQSEFFFIYDAAVVNVEKQVSVSFENETIEGILDDVFANTNIVYRVNDRQIALTAKTAVKADQEDRTITGTVKDSGGEPLPGVTVVVEGTTIGTVTDFDGKFSLKVPANTASVQVSFVGMRTQVLALDSKSVYTVTMEEETIGLDEVVAIGYGVQRKSDLTGSISSVKSEDLENRSITTVDRGIQGKTAGVQVVTTSGAPGAETSVRIRGYSSNSSSTPLYIVDGLRTTNIGYLDPSDIESMEILKDAASAAIYGAQAGNGVILITTKKASQGTLRIDYNMQYSIQQVARVPEVLNAEEYIQYAVTEGNLVSQSRIDQYYDGTTDTDWADVAFENGAMQRHSLSFQGANEKSSIYGSFSYLGNDGPIIGDQDKNERLTGTVNAEYKIKPWAKFSSNNNFASFNTTRVREGGMYSMLASVIQMDPLTPIIYSKDNVPAHIQALLDQGHAFLQDENGDYYSMSPFQESNNINPYIMRDGYQQQSEGFNFRGVSSIDLTPWNTITVTSRLGYDFSSYTFYNLTWPHTANTDTNTDYVVIDAGSMDRKYWQWENFVNYNETFNELHNVGAMVGTSYSERNTFGVSGSVSGSSADNIGITKLDRNYAYFANATGTATKEITGGEKRTYAELAYFGRLSYNYDNKYFLQGSLRADAADLSILPLNTRWGYFPSGSAGWTISRENFFENLNLNWLSHMKLRASWGQNGSISGLGDYMYAATITSDVMYPFTNSTYQVGSYPSSTGNYNLQWETSEQLDFGLDMRMLKDRLTFTMDWYKKETKDLIMTTVNSSAVVGNTISPLNAGNVVNKGFEFDLSWKDKIGDFSYGISGNLATLDNEVTYIYPTLSRVEGSSGGSGVASFFEVGYPIWYMRGYEYLGVDPADGSPIFNDLNTDGIINDADKTMIGSAIPDFTYGLTINLAYKGFDLIVFGNGSYGNDICYAIPRAVRMQANTLKHFFDGRWTTPGQDAKYIAASLPDYSNYVQSSAMVFDGSYFKIKQIQLGYNVPKGLLDRTNVFNNARVYVSLDDFFVFTDYPGFDPEVSMSGDGLGLDYGQYPTTRRVTFGVNLSF